MIERWLQVLSITNLAFLQLPHIASHTLWIFNDFQHHPFKSLAVGDDPRSSLDSEVDFSSVSRIYSNSFAFLLLDDAKLPQCWGRSGYGGGRMEDGGWTSMINIHENQILPALIWTTGYHGFDRKIGFRCTAKLGMIKGFWIAKR